MRETVRALVRDWREKHPGDLEVDAWGRAFSPEFSRKVAAAGLIGMTWPRRVGPPYRRIAGRADAR